jgi:hypothetical protein
MIAATSSRLAHLARAAAPAFGLLAAITILLRFPPEQYSFYPQCPIHRYLHILCPGCGATRALAALLHGNFAEALRLNALTTLLTPGGLIYGAASYRSILARKPLRWPQPPPAAVYATLAATALFTIARNF